MIYKQRIFYTGKDKGDVLYIAFSSYAGVTQAAMSHSDDVERKLQVKNNDPVTLLPVLSMTKKAALKYFTDLESTSARQ
jgi:hypothetical protein